MNKFTKYTIAVILLLAGTAQVRAFDDPVHWTTEFLNSGDRGINTYGMTGNPAAYIPFEEAKESLDIFYGSQTNNYRRTFDPVSVTGYEAVFTAFRHIDDRSFFSFSIDYTQDSYHDHFASMEKDFYDDYFSMIDSTTGNASYYGPKLQFLYQTQIGQNLFLGVDVDYGVERSLKDTFPETIIIMRSSDYKLGLDYRRDRLSLNTMVRYYDGKNDYEAVKEYTDVNPYTFMGYNIMYNDVASSTVGKIRERKGTEFSCGMELYLGNLSKLNIAYSLFERESQTWYKRGSRSYERGYWFRSGYQLAGALSFQGESPYGLTFFGEMNDFSDWGSFTLVNTLVLDNTEKRKKAGFLISYDPGMLMSTRLGGEIGTWAYAYEEYIFPFQVEKEVTEWRLFVQEQFYLTSKTEVVLGMDYGREGLMFYWDADMADVLSVSAEIEHFFPFGYVGLDLRYAQMRFDGEDAVNSFIQAGISYTRK